MNNKLIEAVADLKEDEVLEEIKKLKIKKIPVLDIISDLQKGMEIVGKRYERKEYFLSEIIMSAEIFKEASEILEYDIKSVDTGGKRIFVIGTIYEDIHDIGKNIVASVLSANGFQVIDLGVNVPTVKFIDAIREHKPKLVGISCLLTTAFENIKVTIREIEKEDLRKDLKILIGGGPVDGNTCRYVNADSFCKNAQEAVEMSKKYAEAI